MLTATQSEALDNVMDRYDVRDPDDVRTFLEERPRAVDLLVEALDVIPRYFGQDPVVVLRMEYDPDGKEQPHVAAWIRTTKPPRDAYESTHQLYRDWYFAFPWDVREQVFITYDTIRS